MAETWGGEPFLTTEQLLLRPFQLADVPLYQAACADPEIMQFLGGPWTPEHTRADMAAANLGAAAGRGMVAIERRADGAFLGAAGLSVERWYEADTQVGWRLVSQFQGQGYATEAGCAWLDYGFGVLGRNRIIAMADVPNQRSISVMKRLGMQFDHEARLRDGDEEFDAAIYVMTAERWRVLKP